MNVKRIDPVEDCFDGSFIRELILDMPITRAFIEILGKLGDMHYYSDFARPFFTVLDPDLWKIKGVEGNDSLRVVFFNRNGNASEAERRLVDAIDGLG